MRNENKELIHDKEELESELHKKTHKYESQKQNLRLLEEDLQRKD